MYNIRVALFILLLSGNLLAESLTITQVSVSPQIVKSKNEDVQINFQISKPAEVVTKIYDAINRLIWQSQPVFLTKGSHAVSWNGKDLNQKDVLPEAYFFTVEAKGEDGEFVSFDLTDMTGGESLLLENLKYNSETHKLTFTAPKTGRYMLRVGIARAFAINTLINNKVVAAGEHELIWDGYDASHVYDSSEHPNLLFGSFGYALSQNHILVRPQDQKLNSYAVAFEQKSTVTKRVKENLLRENLSPHSYRPVDQARDVKLNLSLPSDLKKNSNGAYIFDKSYPIKIDLMADDVMVMEAQRGEIVLFLDNQLIHDNEVSYYPYTFNWGPKILDGKEHLLTFFVAGFAGNIGTATIKVQLGKPQ
jgi:hypothetical protein